MMKKVILVIISIVALLFAFFSCERMFDNPYDANSNKDTWAPDSLDYFVISPTEVKLTWLQNETRIDGFVIDKYTENGWTYNYDFVPKDQRVWFDSNYLYNPQCLVKYRINAIAGDNKSDKEELEIMPELAEIIIKKIVKENSTLNITIDITSHDLKSDILESGVCYANNQIPTYDNDSLLNRINDSIYQVILSKDISGEIHFRAYAKNAFGTSYSADTLISILFDQRDANSYKTVNIGSQVWMAENLRYLPSVTHYSYSSYDEKCYYVSNYFDVVVAQAVLTEEYCKTGVLYNWTAAMNGASNSSSLPSGISGICPAGWHLPSYDEWMQLITYLGGMTEAGGKLKEVGTAHWNSPNEGANNETGFNALPGGQYYSYGGSFVGYGTFTGWWTTNNDNNSNFYNAITISLSTNNNSVRSYGNYKNNGYSVRCVKN